MYRFLCSRRYVNLLFLLSSGKNIHQLSREPKVNMTISHLSNVTDQWKQEGIILKNKSGRETEIKLTEAGKKLVEIVKQYDELAKTQLNKIKNVEVKDGEVKGQSKVV